MGYMKATDDSYPKYVQHLVSSYMYMFTTILFIFLYSGNMSEIYTPQASEKKNLYGSFRTWVTDKYSSTNGTLTHDQWKVVMEEDNTISYTSTISSEATNDAIIDPVLAENDEPGDSHGSTSDNFV